LVGSQFHIRYLRALCGRSPPPLRFKTRGSLRTSRS
jgi:hypothetical protein